MSVNALAENLGFWLSKCISLDNCNVVKEVMWYEISLLFVLSEECCDHGGDQTYT